MLILEKKIPPLGSMLYSPMLDRRQQLTIRNPDFLAKIREIAKDVSAIFFRAEIDVPSDRSKPPTAAGFIKAFEEIQPEHTLVLNISKPEEEILREMKPKGRYNIKVAEKHGVRVIKGLPADATALQAGKIEDFYKLYETTARRQKITHRALSYFQNLVDILGKKGYVKVFMAKASQQSAVSRMILPTASCKPLTMFWPRLSWYFTKSGPSISMAVQAKYSATSWRLTNSTSKSFARRKNAVARNTISSALPQAMIQIILGLALPDLKNNSAAMKSQFLAAGI